MKDQAISFDLSSEDLGRIEDCKSTGVELDEAALAEVNGGATLPLIARNLFVACNAAFVACNAAFKALPSFVACNAAFKARPSFVACNAAFSAVTRLRTL
jgi:hypothetical protein